MLAVFLDAAPVRRLVIPLANILTKNIVYTISFDGTKIRRKGGIGVFPGVGKRNRREEQFIASLDLKGTTVYDIGAYKGILTTFFGKAVGDTGRVIAFEPHPDNYTETIKTIELNHLQNVDVMNIGIADTTGNTTLAVRYNSTGTSSMNCAIQSQILSEKHTGLLHVSIDTLDHCIVFNHLPAPNFIKLDIEGMEYKALQGMSETLRQYSPDMYIELHGADEKSKIANIESIMELLQFHHYKVFHVESQKFVTRETAEQASSGHIYCSQKSHP